MIHEESLKLLFPVELSGVFEDDIALEGAALDIAQADGEMLLTEIFPDEAHNTLANWERVCGITSKSGQPLQYRRNAVLDKLRERGGLSKAYFIALAAIHGWTITIDELLPFMAGWNRCGDQLYEEEARWVWRVNVADTSAYYFRTGVSAAGERLSGWIANTTLEDMFEDLKPAHTAVIFNYA